MESGVDVLPYAGRQSKVTGRRNARLMQRVVQLPLCKFVRCESADSNVVGHDYNPPPAFDYFPCFSQTAEWMFAAVLFRSVGKGEGLSEKAMSRFDVFHMARRRGKAAGLPTPPVAIRFALPELPLISKTAGRLSMPRLSPITNRRGPPSCTTTPARSSPPKRLDGLGSELIYIDNNRSGQRVSDSPRRFCRSPLASSHSSHSNKQ